MSLMDSLKVSIKVSHNGPNKKDFSKDELELLDIDNLQETIYTVTFPEKLTSEEKLGIEEMLKLETKIPMKYLKPIPNSCIYVAQKSKLLSSSQNDIDTASVRIEPMNPDWSNGQVRFLPINQSIPLDTIFMISKTIPYNGKFEWVMSSDITTSRDLKELILSENPSAKSFVLTNQKVYLFGQDIGSKLEGKFKVSMTDEIFDNMRLFRFKRPKQNQIEFIVYDFMDITLKNIMEKALKVCKNKNGKNVIESILKVC